MFVIDITDRIHEHAIDAFGDDLVLDFREEQPLEVR